MINKNNIWIRKMVIKKIGAYKRKKIYKESRRMSGAAARTGKVRKKEE